MLSKTRFSIAETNRRNNCSVLALDGKILNLELQGVIIEAQYELKDEFTLIFLTEDSPNDEGLHIYLISENSLIADSLETNTVFTPGIFKLIKTGENWVEFTFFQNDSTYKLTVKKTKSLQLALPRGWKYKEYLKLHRLVIQKL